MIKIGDIVEYRYLNKSFYGIVIRLFEDDCCFVDWFDTGVDKLPSHNISLTIVSSNNI
jgi:hypothetical protein